MTDVKINPRFPIAHCSGVNPQCVFVIDSDGELWCVWQDALLGDRSSWHWDHVDVSE